MTLLIIAIAGFFIFTMWGRIASEKGMKTLTEDQIATVRDRFTKSRKWSVILLSVIILSFILVSAYFKIDKVYAMYSYFVAFLLYTMFMSGLALSGLKKLGMPDEYIRSVWLASILRLLGLIVLVICMIIYLSQHAEDLKLSL